MFAFCSAYVYEVNVVPTHFFRIKLLRGKKYLYKVKSYRNGEKYPKQKNQFVGSVERIKKVINNA